MEKTNVMRLLDQKKIPYTPHAYDPSVTDGVSVAQLLGVDEKRVFKTLATISGTGAYAVFVIPVAHSLDLKKAAKAVSAKSIAMLPQKDLLGLTGYVHGGCSPIGMKKPLVTVLDASALLFDTITISAGKVGFQVQLDPNALAGLAGARFAALTADEEQA